MLLRASEQEPIRVGILVLNYRHLEATLGCVKNLPAREPASARVFWMENDAKAT
jgi:hypothetical protein